MPRNSSGIYTLPQPVFVPNTVIQSAAVNSDFADIASALTQSLATTGVSSMTGALKLASGSLSIPGLIFANSVSTGFFNDGTVGSFSYSAQGVLVFKLNPDATTTWSKLVTFNGNIAQGVSSSATFSGSVTFVGTTALNGIVTVGGSSFTVNINSVFNGGVTFNQAIIAANTTTFESGMYFTTTATASIVFTQCRLVLSGGSLKLIQYNGSLLWINGQHQIVPFSGVTLGNGSTIASTYYYIYAFMNSTTLTLEASTTAPTVDSGSGLNVKTGDATRTLVGAAITTSGNAWSDTDGFIGVLSWYNRKRKRSMTRYTATRNVPNVYGEINSEIRNSFISWADEIPEIFANLVSNTNGNSNTIINLFGLGVDSTTTPTVGAMGEAAVGATNFTVIASNIMQLNPTGLTEAAGHFATILGVGNNNSNTQVMGGSLTTTVAPAASYLVITVLG